MVLLGIVYDETMDRPLLFRRWPVVLLTVLAGALLNGFLNRLNVGLQSPFFADSVFTAVVGALAGPWAGMATGFLSSILVDVGFLHDGSGIAFVPCQLATGLICGLAPAWRRFPAVLGLLITIGTVALVNSVFGSIIATFLFGGVTGHGSDFLVSGFLMAGQSLLSASFWARVPLNLIDKGVAVLAAWITWRWLNDAHRD